jgi:hypothetical protein
MKLIINGKTYVAPTPKARMVRRAIALTQEINFNDLKPEEFDILVGYVVDIFGKQFTIDDIYDGLDADKLMPTIMKCLTDVAGKIGAKLSELPNARTGL